MNDSTPPAQSAQREATFYVASKTKHAAMWRRLRDSGVRINSTWIDEAGEGESASYKDLSNRCVEECSNAAVTLLYCEPGEVLKGALIEVGIALRAGRMVFCVGGNNESMSRVFRKHANWHEFDTVESAIESAPPQAQGADTPETDAIWKKALTWNKDDALCLMHDHSADLERRLSASRAREESMRKDAERYAFLRNFGNFAAVDEMLNDTKYATLDSAVDERMALATNPPKV